MNWKKNEFITFYAVMKVKIGGEPPIEIDKGDSFEYDGSILKFNGHEIPSASLRGAVKSGWVVASEDQVNMSAPAHVVNRNLAKSQTKNNGGSGLIQRSEGNLSLSETDEGDVASVTARRGSGLRDTPKRILNHSDSQDGQVVARLRTSSNLGPVDVSQKSNLAKSLEDRNWERPDYVQSGKYPIFGDSEGRVVSQVRNSPSRDDKSGLIVPRRFESEREEKVSVSTKQTLSANPKVRVAQRIFPDFPSEWDFTGKMSERLARVKNYSEDPAFLEALYAAENDQFRKVLASEYPDLFGGVL